MITLLSRTQGHLLPHLTRSLSKVTFNDFLVAHAKFPYPTTTGTPTEPISKSVFTSDISTNDVKLLEPRWKATHAVRDPLLTKKLCDSLRTVLGSKLLDDRQQKHLLAYFSPEVEFDDLTGLQLLLWKQNGNESDSSQLLHAGVFSASERCLLAYNRHQLRTTPEHMVEDSTAKVDYLVRVDDIPKVLVEVKSPSVMQNAGPKLPLRGIELSWRTKEPPQVKILTKAAEYLGRRKLEWLFVTSHNEWVICRLVHRNGHRPFMAYSDMFTMQDSSVPFRAFLGAILGVNVEPSVFDPKMELDIIKKGKHGLSESSPKGGARSKNSKSDSDLMLAKYFPDVPPDSDFYTWSRLHSLSGDSDTLTLPQCAKNSEGRLWMTNFLASGSTGTIFQCRFHNSNEVFIVKIFDTHRSDADIRKHFLNEFKVYCLLEGAHRSGMLYHRITPRCYGAFEGDDIAILILEPCGHSLKDWNELSALEQFRVYELAKKLHFIGLDHGDLEPRNVVHDDRGGFRLIDFSMSYEHTCSERKFGKLHTPHPAQNKMCLELLTLRSSLQKLHLKPYRNNTRICIRCPSVHPRVNKC